MKKKTLIFFLFTTSLFSCQSNPKNALKYLSGYWEIEKVVLEDGREKSFPYNEMIDYIEINDHNMGYRKKLKPLFNGTFETSKVTDKLQLKIENDSLNIYYQTKYDHWKESILKISKTHLKILNKNNTVYLYKRYVPIN